MNARWVLASCLLVGAAEAKTIPIGDAPPDLPSLRGKVVVLNFWATWCAPCVKELPELVEVSRRFSGDDVAFVTVAAEPVSEMERVERVLAERGIALPAWIGADASDMERFGLSETLPATVVVDREGDPVARIQGTFDRADLEGRVRAALEGGPKLAKAQTKGAARGGSRVPS